MFKVAVFNDTSGNKHYGCAAVSYTLNNKLNKYNLSVAKYWPCALDWRSCIDQVVEALSGVNAIIVNGEGTIHDSKSRPRVAYCTEIANLAKDRLKIPAYLINASVNNLDDRAFDNIRNFKDVYVRETSSKSYLESHGISSTFVPDLSFGSLPDYVPYPERDGILLTDSVFPDISQSLRNLSNDMGHQFLSMSYRNTRSKNLFSRVYKKIISKFSKNRSTPAGFYSCPRSVFEHYQWLQMLLEKSFIVTGRFHTVTLCILTETPFVAVPSNTSKIESLLLDVYGNTSRLMDPNSLNETSLNDIFRSSLTCFSSYEIDLMRSYKNKALSSIDKMFHEVYLSVSSH